MALRPRVSLLSLLLLVALSACAVVITTLWREVGPLRREVARLRTETGQLTVVDPGKAYVVAIETMDPDTWKWRVHLPAGHDYRLKTKVGQIAGWSPGLTRIEWMRRGASVNCSTSIDDGEFTITVKLHNDPAHPNGEGHWNVRTQTTRSAGGNPAASVGGVCGTAMGWLADPRSRHWESDARVSDPQVELDAANGIELLTLRRSVISELPNGWTSTPAANTEDGDGLAVWIVPR